ncbi:MAG: SCO family protein, partial [Myxococcales bacterium]
MTFPLPSLSRRALWMTTLGALLPAAIGCRRAADLPALGSVGSFGLTDQSGRPVNEAVLRGQVWAAAFFFTRCPTVCPRITRRMRDLQQAAASGGVKLQLVSFSVDPENDTPEALTA